MARYGVARRQLHRCTSDKRRTGVFTYRPVMPLDTPPDFRHHWQITLLLIADENLETNVANCWRRIISPRGATQMNA